MDYVLHTTMYANASKACCSLLCRINGPRKQCTLYSKDGYHDANKPVSSRRLMLLAVLGPYTMTVNSEFGPKIRREKAKLLKQRSLDSFVCLLAKNLVTTDNFSKVHIF